MDVARSKRRINVSQRKYVLDLLNETKMLGCKPSNTLIEAGNKSKVLREPVDRNRYQRLVGKLIYLSHTRPNIVFGVTVVSQHMYFPKEAHFEAVYKILIYLKRFHSKGLFLKKNENKGIEVFTNTD